MVEWQGVKSTSGPDGLEAQVWQALANSANPNLTAADGSSTPQSTGERRGMRLCGDALQEPRAVESPDAEPTASTGSPMFARYPA